MSSLPFPISCLRRLFRVDGGNIALITAVAAPVLLAAVGGAADYANAVRLRTDLQAAADASALAAANEFAVSGSRDPDITAAAVTMANAQIEKSNGQADVTTTIDRKGRRITVGISQRWTPFFAHFLDAGVTPINVSATASFMGTSNICVLALAGNGLTGVHLNLLARVEARGCGVYSNTRSLTGTRLDALPKIHASLICSAGGVLGLLSNMRPMPVTDCPQMKDPLATRKAPDVGGCDFSDVRINKGTETLKPGVYCGGISISGSASVSFAPGLFIIKDGPFAIRGKSEAVGRDTGFFLTGPGAVLSFKDQARISLSGPESGAMAGILFFEDRAMATGRLHVIRSTRVEQLTGTVSLPRGTLLVDPNATVAEESAYTAIIADRLAMTEGPTLVLKADYDATHVPVPAGIRSVSQIVLSQ